MSAPRLSVRGLTARLDRFTLGPLDFELPAREIAAFLGDNGAGKTSTMRLVMAMLRKQRGTVSYAGLDHVEDEIAFKQRIAFASDELSFYGSFRVRDLVRFVAWFHPDWDRSRERALLERFRLAEDAPISALSKGMRVKLGLTLALARRPAVLLLDEPTAGLDPRSRVELFTLLEEARRLDGTAILFSTHQIDEVERLADHVLVLQRGRLVADASLAQARQQAGSLERFFLEVAP